MVHRRATTVRCILLPLICLLPSYALRATRTKDENITYSNYFTENNSTVPTNKQPIKVFLLSGQSNMVGMASEEHLRKLIEGTSDGDECPCDYQTLWNGSDFRERDDVFMQFEDRRGKLRAAYYGAVKGRSHHFGPEVGFGWTVGDALHNETIIMIKSAFGGRSLAVDFRPPSAGEGNYSNVLPSHYGWEYRQMVTDFNDALQNLSSIYPDYDKEAGYELAGFVWFQGWNDMLNEDTTHEYSSNLAHFIRDVRLEFKSPLMPFVVGELGMHGLHPEGKSAPRVLYFREAQRNTTLLPEFRNNTLFVPTASYMKFNVTTYNGGYHYNGRADTYYRIGQAMGRGMLQLSKTTKTTAVTEQHSLHEWWKLRQNRVACDLPAVTE
jgi:alpha-galactosidase